MAIGRVGSGFEELFTLLDQLEQQAEAAYDLERLPELYDRSRAEYAAVTLASRLMATLGDVVVVDVPGPGSVEGRVVRATADWCAVRGPAQDWVIRLAAVGCVRGASPRSVPEVAWSPLARLGFGSALRRLADGGQRCVVWTRDGAHDVRLRRVGADFVEAETGRRRMLLLSHAAITAVQSRD